MKILAPVINHKDVKQLVDSGSDEFYCGIITKKWMDDYSHMCSNNRLEHIYGNLKSFKDLKLLVEESHSYSKPVFLTINAPYYTKQQYNTLMDEINQSINAGVDALIINDINLLTELKDFKIELHLSALSNCFNKNSIGFFKEFGVKRIVLPEHLSISEIKVLSKELNKNNIKPELFILKAFCQNIDGLCTFHHGLNDKKNNILIEKLKQKSKEVLIRNSDNLIVNNLIKMNSSKMSPCLIDYKIKSSEKENSVLKNNIKEHFSSKERLMFKCAVCSLSELKDSDIHSVKIAGRSESPSKKSKDIQFVKESINILNKDIEKNKFVSETKNLFSEIYKKKCSKFNCF